MHEHTTYVAVDRAALAHNARQVLGLLGEGTGLMAVVKCDAYGHGLVESARIFIDAGASWLGVSSVAEGVALREAGLDAPVLLFMPAARGECEALVAAGLTGTVAQSEHISWLHEAAAATGKRAAAHLYIDTGLGRMASDDSAPQLMDLADGLGDVDITGVYTHYGPPGSGAMGDWMEVFRAGLPVKMFRRLAGELLEGQGRSGMLLHCAASALTLDDPDSHLGLVRAGTLLYGQYPDHAQRRDLDLRNTFELRTRVAHVGTVGVGGKIGYGGEFQCRRVTRVATLPVGYWHGLGTIPQSLASRAGRCMKYAISRWMSGWGRSWHPQSVRIGEGSAPIIGRISMDHCAVDVTDLPDVRAGDVVVLPVRRVGTNQHIPRVYVEDAD